MSESSSDFWWEVDHSLDILNAAIDHREITAMIGLVPRMAWNVGDPQRDPSKPPYAFSRWIYTTPKWTGDTPDMNRCEHVEALRDLIAHIHDRRHVLTRLRPPAEIGIQTKIFSDSFNMCYGVPSDSVRLLADLEVQWFVSATSMSRGA